jgi:hypothetical protein
MPSSLPALSKSTKSSHCVQPHSPFPSNNTPPLTPTFSHTNQAQSLPLHCLLLPLYAKSTQDVLLHYNCQQSPVPCLLTHFSPSDHPHQQYQSRSSSSRSLLQPSLTCSLLTSNIFLSTKHSKHPQSPFFPQYHRPSFTPTKRNRQITVLCATTFTCPLIKLHEPTQPAVSRRSVQVPRLRPALTVTLNSLHQFVQYNVTVVRRFLTPGSVLFLTAVILLTVRGKTALLRVGAYEKSSEFG